MSKIENIEKKHALLMHAFEDKELHDELELVCREIKNKITEWIESADKIDNRIDNVFSVQSRVKGISSFEEKLYRKNYINTWEVSEDKKQNQKCIKHNLTDLIGIRVNCYFAEYEERIYKYCEMKKDSLPDFVFNFNENTQQNNGNKIFKFSGKYNNLYQFEIQIKSVVHNIWGEVEHKTVYKNPSFDGFIEKKKELTQSLHQVLLASDNQLLSIFRMQEDEDALIKSLFFCMTKDVVKEKCKTGVLANHYENYFRAFTDLTKVKHFIASKLEEKQFDVEKVQIQQDEEFSELISRFREEFPIFFIECLFAIDSILNQHESLESFVYYFVKSIISFDVEDEYLDERTNDCFSDDEDLESNPIEDYLNRLNQILGNCRINK